MSLSVSLVAYLKTFNSNVSPGRLPSSTPPLPHIVYQKVSGRELVSVDGEKYHRRARYQLDVYSDSLKQSAELSQQIRDAANGFSGDLFGTSVGVVLVDEGREGIDSGLYRVTTDLSISYQ